MSFCNLPRPVRRSLLRPGFTLVELLVVIAIIGFLAAVLLPAVNAAIEAARRISCGNHLRQIGLAINDYVAKNGSKFPAGSRPVPNHLEFEPIAWSVDILPHLEQRGVFDELDLQGFDLRSTENLPGTSTVISTYLCPSADQDQGRREGGRLTDFVPGSGTAQQANDDNWTEGVGEKMGCIDYMGIAGPNKGFLNNSANPQKYKKQQGVLIDLVDLIENGRPPTRVRHRDLTDGVSHTMMVAESTTRSVWFDPEKKPQAKWELSGAWASGENISHIEHPINAINATGLPDGTETEEVLVDGEIRTRRIEPEEEIYSDHPGGAHLLFADASVHFASSDTPTRVLAALATRSGTKNWGENPHPSADDVE